MDITPTLAPRSDQLNADDLITGPITITITAVKKGSREQPVEVHWEGGESRPYKPSKSMRRVMAYCWSPQSAEWIGRSLTLYRDDSIKYGGVEVGGIRISHLSHIEKPKQVALTVTRGKREPYIVEPLPRPTPTQSRDELVPEDRLTYLRERGDECARDGTEALRDFWRGLNANERAALSPLIDKWKSEAAHADARDKTPTDDGDLFA